MFAWVGVMCSGARVFATRAAGHDTITTETDLVSHRPLPLSARDLSPYPSPTQLESASRHSHSFAKRSRYEPNDHPAVPGGTSA